MQQLLSALDALIGIATDVVVGASASSARGYQSTLEAGADLRSELALREIVGPALHKLVLGVSGEVERRAVPRFKSILAHPRHGREQLIDEIDAAQTELNNAIHQIGSPPDAAAGLRIAFAIIRVCAITKAAGEKAFVDPRGPKGGKAPTQRRRTISVADLGEDVARTVIAAVDAGDQWRAALDPLRALESTDANRNGVATKIVAFADMPDGRAIVERIAAVARPHFPPLEKRASKDASATDVPVAGSERPSVTANVDRVASPVIESLSTYDQNGARLSISEIARRQREERNRR